MDLVSHRIANALVGNERTAASLEATLVGPETAVRAPARSSRSPAPTSAPRSTAQAIPLHTPVRCRPGSVLRFGERAFGRAGVHRVRRRHRRSARPRQPGDAHAAADRRTRRPARCGGRSTGARRGRRRQPLARRQRSDRRALAWRCAAARAAGPAARLLSRRCARRRCERTRFTSRRSRIAWGTACRRGTIPRVDEREMISDATFTGALQVPPSGDPILLMADRQTTGGYPQIAIVITADLPLAGQLAPGDWIEFERLLAARRDLGARRAGRRDSCAPLSARSAPRAGVPLAPLSTLGVGGAARWFVHAPMTRRTWRPRTGGARSRAIPLFVLGGGSNLVIADEGFDGLVLQIAIEGISITRDAGDTLVRAGAGEPWDAVVADGRRARAGRARMPVRHSGHRRRHADSERRRLRTGSGRHDRARDGLRLRRARDAER